MSKLRLATLVVAILAFTHPAAGAGNVSVNLKVSTGHYNVTKTVCSVSVPAASDGVKVLDAARSSGCIRSYTLTYHPVYGPYVACIDDVCEVPGTYWAMRENCTYTSYGVAGFRSDQGDELSFTYESWGHFVLPEPCS